MNYEDFKKEIRAIEADAEKKKRELARSYAEKNNPYSVGDIVTDHMGSVEVDQIQISVGNQNNPPQCVYNGIILNKDGSYNKRGKRRGVYQCNIKEE